MISGVEDHAQVCLSTMPPPQCPPSRLASSVLTFATHARGQTLYDKMVEESCLLRAGANAKQRPGMGRIPGLTTPRVHNHVPDSQRSPVHGEGETERSARSRDTK